MNIFLKLDNKTELKNFYKEVDKYDQDNSTH